MPVESRQHQRPDPLRQELVQITIKFGIVIGVLLVFRSILPRLPVTHRVVYQPMLYPPATVATVGFSIIMLLMFAAILSYATSIGSRLATFYDFGPIERIVQLIALLVVIVWSYRIFYWVPYFGANPDHYDLLFLLLGLGVAGWLGYIVYTHVDDLSELFTRKVVTGTNRYASATKANLPNNEPPSNNPINNSNVPSRGTRSDAESGNPERPDQQDSPEGSSAMQTTPSVDKGSARPSDSISTPEETDVESDGGAAESGSDGENETHCPECTTSLPGDAQFCYACGSALGD